MSDLKSRVAYLQGLTAGMELDTESKEGKLLNGIIDVLQDFADSFDELEEAQEQLENYVETIDEDLCQLEDDFYEATDYVEVECPNCGETVCFDSDILDDDEVVEITCPNCDEVVYINDDSYVPADEPERLEGKEHHTFGGNSNPEEDI